MCANRLACLALVAAGYFSCCAFAVSPTSDEMASRRAWFDRHLGPNAATLPFSFSYAGRSSSDLLSSWHAEREVEKLDANRMQRTLTFTDRKTGLTVRCVSVEYRDFPTVEWIVYIQNTGHADTPILKDIQGLDVRLWRDDRGEFVLHHNIGSPDAPNAFQTLETMLAPNADKRITAKGGRPTNSDLCYFNVQWPGKGVIVALGWPGQWAAHFARDEANGLRIRAGQELTHLRLRPGEEIRTPLIVLQFWEGEWIRSQNIWRRWMVAHNLPRPGGKLVPTHFGSCWGSMPCSANEDIEQINGWARQGIKLDYWFLDAGWYPCHGVWWNTGTWQPDSERFPRGLRELSDHVHAKDMKFVVWFEPERVRPGTWLYENRSEWLLGCADETSTAPQLVSATKGGAHKLLNLGNPEARQWLIDHIDGMLKDHRIDVYRQDFNLNPLDYWRASDAPDRQGITENAYVTGYLAYWDELLRRNPNRWIDTCASGGRRNDLETLRRSVPLLRSDYWQDPIGQQCHTYGLSLWMPYYGSGAPLGDPYAMRSAICPAYRIGCDMRNKDQDFDLLRRTVKQFRQIEPYLLGDYYPLTPYSLAKDAWMAWQFDRPEMGEGVVQAFRRPECTDEVMRLRLRGLDGGSEYAVADLDEERPRQFAGRELMDRGLSVRIPNQPGAVLLVYRKCPSYTMEPSANE